MLHFYNPEPDSLSQWGSGCTTESWSKLMGPGTVWPNTSSFRLNPVMSWITSLSASNKQPWVFPKPGLIHITPTAESSAGLMEPLKCPLALNVIMPYSDSFQNLSKQMWWKVWGLNNLYHLYDNCGGNLSAETLKPSEAARTVNDICNLQDNLFWQHTKKTPQQTRENPLYFPTGTEQQLHLIQTYTHQAQAQPSSKPDESQAEDSSVTITFSETVT